jgi:hypothetical protein
MKFLNGTILALSALAVAGAALAHNSNLNEVKADAPQVAKYTIGSMKGLHTAYTPYDESNLELDCTNGSSVFYYDNDGSLYQDFEVSYKIGEITHNGGQIIFTLRGGQTLNGGEAKAAGYQVYWGQAGAAPYLDIRKENSAQTFETSGTLKQPSAGDVITMDVSTVDASVVISVALTYADSAAPFTASWTDTENVIASGTIGAVNSGWGGIAYNLRSTLELSGSELSLLDASRPSFPDNTDHVVENGILELNSLTTAYDSSASFPTFTSKKDLVFSFNAKFNTFNGGDSLFAVSIGARKSVSSTPLSCNQGEGYWDSCGYMFVWWNPWGAWSVHGAVGAEEVGASSYQGGASLTDNHSLVPELGTTYKITIEYHRFGANALVRMFVDGVVVSSILDTEGSATFVDLPADGETYVNLYSRRSQSMEFSSAATSTVVPEISDWANTYLKMDDPSFDGKGSGTCKSEGLYDDAKTELLKLDPLYVSVFELNGQHKYDDAHARYEAWAAANGDNSPYQDGKSEGAFLISTTNNSSFISLFALATTVILAGGLMLLWSKKRKGAER